MTYLIHPFKLQSLKNKVRCTIGNFATHNPIRDLDMTSRLPYVYHFIINYRGRKQNSYKITRSKMFATLDKTKQNVETKSSYFAVMMPTTIRPAELPF
jgi:hypothetical protein